MPDVVFVGVSTRQSLVHRVWPRWQSVLGTACGVRSVELGLGADDADFVRLLDRMRDDAGVAGAVVTAHKVRVFSAGQLCFARLDPLALACREVNAIRRAPDGLWGWARDPVSVGRIVDRIWPSPDGQVVCLGAGGTARALAHHLASRRAVTFVAADRDPAAAGGLSRQLARRLDVRVGEGPWDELVAAAPPASLVVNATGMGKDRPGAPTSDAVRFPEAAVVWELNYRGDLSFLPRRVARPGRGVSRSTTGGSCFATVGPRRSASFSVSPTTPVSAIGSPGPPPRSARRDEEPTTAV
ncbi:MAG: shikimate dehydrogenase family protein [Acidimicrobiales bacterium]